VVNDSVSQACCIPTHSDSLDGERHYSTPPLRADSASVVLSICATMTRIFGTGHKRLIRARCEVFCLLFVLVAGLNSAFAQTLTYHLDNPSGVAGQWLLSTNSPTGTVRTVSSQSLSGAAPGEYPIASFPGASGDPGRVGTIPSGSAVTFTLSMNESKNGGTIFPRAKLYLNSPSGTLLCVGTGTTAITSTATRFSFSCSTTAPIAIASTDRFFLWVGVNMTKVPTGSSLTANLQFNGPQGGISDSTAVAPVPPPPSITSLSVTSGNAGTPVTISGAHFGSTTGTVTFNGANATVSSWTDGTIGTLVPALASNGNVLVTNVNGVSNGIPFTIPPPAISSLSTSSGAAGTPVTIAGTHFGASQGTGTVTFNGTTATVSNWSDVSISTAVPVLATTGIVVVTAANGEASTGLSFTIPAPIITNINPDFARVGTSVTVTGNNFGSQAGSLTFNGSAAIPTSWNNTQIVTTVPNGTTTGPVVVTQAGTSNAISFTVEGPPSITSISPASGPANSSVTVTGSGFGIPQGTSSIQFNGAAATPFSWSDGSIIVPVPVGATTGPVVVSSGGFNSNGVTFTVVPGPNISGLSTSSGAPGTAVTINGQNFGSTQGTSVVRFNGLPASVTTWGSNAIGVTVPSGATAGPVTVTVTGQISNGLTFTVITTGTLLGTISSGTSGPLSGATVQALQNGTVKGSATSSSDGSYSIPSLAFGSYDVQASATGFGTALLNSVAITAGQNSAANFSFSSPGTISGKVTQADGVTPIPGASLQLFVGSAEASTAVTDATGSYSISSLNAGSYALQAGAGNYVSQTQNVTVTGGNTSTSNFILQAVGVNPINYVYDELGRLVSVIDSSGDTATYKYDAVGNILSISRQNSNQLSIISFTPQSGPSGASVTINGTGFSTTTTQDSVNFNGVAATVTAATATQITVLVPANASSGPITVTIPSASASSSTNFTVLTSPGVPTISGFTPNMGVTGTAVTVNGTNFDVANNDNLKFNTTTAGLTSATSTQVSTVVPINTTSGRITIGTPAGTVTSTQDVYIPFGSYGVGDIGFTGRMTFGSTQNIAITTSGKIGLILFDGNQGQKVSIQTSGGNFVSCALDLFDPQGNQRASVACNVASAFMDGQLLPWTGTYTLGIDTFGNGTGSFNLTLNNATDVTASITPGVPLNTTISVPGQNARHQFTGTANQQVSLNITNSTFTGACLPISILKPDGFNTLTSNRICTSGMFIDSMTLPVTGTYTLLIDPQGTNTGSVTASLSVFNDVTGPITPGTPINLTTGSPGQNARYTFSATAGQQASVSLSHSTYTGGCVGTSILKPDGGTLSSICNTGFLDSTTLPVDGTYTVLIDPQGTSTGSATVLLSLFNDITGSITPGTPLNVSTTAPGQNALFTFSANAGQQGSVSTTNSTYPGCTAVTVSVLKPDGSTLGSGGYCGTSGLLSALTFPVTGTYTVVLNPQATGTGSATLLLSIFNDITGSITPGTPISFSTSSPGQNARYTFSGAVGQVVSTEVAGFTGGNFTITLLNPDGSTLASSCCNSNQGSITGKTLATTGNYQIVIAPSVTSSATVSLVTQTTNAAINFGTPVTNTISVPALVGLSFSGTAGQVVSAEAAGLSGNFWLVLLKPDGTQLGSSFGSGTLNLTGKTLATSGTYQIVLIPNNAVTGAVTVSLVSQTTNAAIAFNTPVMNTVSSSSLIGLSFSGTAGQVVSAEAAGLNGNFWLILLNPDGSQLASAFGSGMLNRTGKALATTGTYQIVLIPNNGVNGSVTISLISQTTNVTINFGTPVRSAISSTSLIGLSFSGTAGQTVSVQVTPSFSAGGFWVFLLNPDGSTLASAFSSTSVTFSGKVAGSTGTYQILIAPNNGVTGSATTSLTSP